MICTPTRRGAELTSVEQLGVRQVGMRILIISARRRHVTFLLFSAQKYLPHYSLLESSHERVQEFQLRPAEPTAPEWFAKTLRMVYVVTSCCLICCSARPPTPWSLHCRLMKLQGCISERYTTCGCCLSGLEDDILDTCTVAQNVIEQQKTMGI